MNTTFLRIRPINLLLQEDLRLSQGKVLNASYRLVLNPSSGEYDVKQYLLSGQWPLSSGWSALASYNYDIYERHDIESMVGSRI